MASSNSDTCTLINSTIQEETNDKPHHSNNQKSSNTTTSRNHCPNCLTRLHHLPTNTILTEENRSTYIANGKMYNEIARLCQEYAQELMQTEGDLEWITICEDTSKGEPIRALVDRTHHLVLAHKDSKEEEEESNGGGVRKNKATLLIVTGKGKVRA
eukprot:12938452-Ditylum_brightwellii.AAC.1